MMNPTDYIKLIVSITTNFMDLHDKNGFNGQKCIIILGQSLSHMTSVTLLKVGHSHHRARAKHEGTIMYIPTYL